MYLRIKLLSDTAFGRGDGVAGLVNDEVEHDSQTGLPFIKGRTIKGLMIESCADILYALKLSGSINYTSFAENAERLFGKPGSDLSSQGLIHFNAGTLPSDFVQYIQQQDYLPHQVLEGLTTIRQQTAIEHSTGSAERGSLRATRVVLRETVFHAPLTTDELALEQYALLAACASGLRNAGLNRSRGLGRICVTLEKAPELHTEHLNKFKQLARG